VTPELNRIYLGDNLATMKTWPDAFVHTCVTSPPYFALRDYGTASWEGGDASCAHSVGGQVPDGKAPGAISAGVRPGVDASKCRKCGAKRIDQQIGLEATPEAYVARLVELFREVRRVLRDDGTLWLNLGDSYNAYNGNRGTESEYAGKRNAMEPAFPAGHGLMAKGLKPKDLIGIPWMVALALRADGWYLRCDIIWAKKNCMPESVTDRPTKAHEYIFLLSKSEKYFYDAEAIKEAITESSIARVAQNDGRPVLNTDRKRDSTQAEQTLDIAAMVPADGRRNKRSVWNVALKPFNEAHFATFPPDLISPCVLAGAPRGGVVLDPFMGAGTTALVAATHDRQYIGCELNPEYKSIADARVANESAQEKML